MKNAIAKLLMTTGRNKPASEVEEELQFHIEMLERKYAQQGLCAADAKAAAAKRFGSLERVKKECVDISSRNSFLRRVLKFTTILVALMGLSITLSSSDFKVARIGHLLITIAVLVRLLLYVRGLGASNFFPKSKA